VFDKAGNQYHGRSAPPGGADLGDAVNGHDALEIFVLIAVAIVLATTVVTATTLTTCTAAKAAGITKVVFDKAGNQYHGRIAALADAAREAGLDF
jgi:hypothetical protein